MNRVPQASCAAPASLTEALGRAHGAARLRVGFDAHVLDGRDQGTKTLMLRLIGSLAKRHGDVDFYVYSQKGQQELGSAHENVHFRNIRHRGFLLHLLYDLPVAAKRDRLDTMAFNFISSPLVPRATVMIHDILPQTHSRFFSWAFVVRCWIFFGISALLARHILTISDYSRREIQRVYPWTRRKRIGVLHIGPSFPVATYVGPDRAVDLPARLSGIGRYALLVGRLERRKNVQMAIDAFHRHAPADASLVIVGRREPGTSISYNDSRIIELSGLSNATLAATYRGADLFLYPSAAEGFGLPLLDAILFGLPTISSNRTSMPEVGGDCATFFDPEAPGATEWLGRAIAAHFGRDHVTPPTIEQRLERLKLYSWDHAADEFMAGIA